MLWSARVVLARNGPNLDDTMAEESCLHWKGEWLPDKWLVISRECDEHIHGVCMVVYQI